MPYRTDVPALEEQRARVWRDLEELRRARMAAESAIHREKELEVELARLEARLKTVRAKSPLDDIRIASPCKASWDDMVGDDRVRFCGMCAKNVYDLSAMTREDAEALLAGHEGEELPCIRLARRKDGTVITRDCPVGERKQRVRLAVITAAGGAAMTYFMATALAPKTVGKISCPNPVPPIGELPQDLMPTPLPPETPIVGKVHHELGGPIARPAPAAKLPSK